MRINTELRKLEIERNDEEEDEEKREIEFRAHMAGFAFKWFANPQIYGARPTNSRNSFAKSQPQIAPMHCESSCSLLGPKRRVRLPPPCLPLFLSLVLLFSPFLSPSRSSLLSLRWNAIDSMHIWQQGSSRPTLYTGWPSFSQGLKGLWV